MSVCLVIGQAIAYLNVEILQWNIILELVVTKYKGFLSFTETPQTLLQMSHCVIKEGESVCRFYNRQYLFKNSTTVLVKKQVHLFIFFKGVQLIFLQYCRDWTDSII